ncbi:MAG: DUF4097 family beta strand repeat-containing protein [Methanopyri archaeon]|jgi:hypothetical protein|nr:DUF4097 family beta strand repeat-containing protein [Methanopyri archaeon]
MMEFDMKRIAMWLAVITIVSFAAGSAVLWQTGGPTGWDGAWHIDGTRRGGLDWDLNLEDVTESAIYEAITFADISDVRLIDVRTVSSPVKIIPVDGDAVTAVWNGTIWTNEPLPEFITEKVGDALLIEIRHPSRRSSFSSTYKLRTIVTIEVPRAYVKDLKIKTISGDVDMGPLEMNRFSCETVSGNVIPRGSAIEFDFATVSGDLTADAFTATRSRVETISGNVQFKGFTGMLEAGTTSGNVGVEYPQLDGDITIKSVSGSVELELPPDAGFQMRATTFSGNISNDFPIKVKGAVEQTLEGTVGDGAHRIVIESVSGNISVSRMNA